MGRKIILIMSGVIVVISRIMLIKLGIDEGLIWVIPLWLSLRLILDEPYTPDWVMKEFKDDILNLDEEEY